jgi:putative Flp pilus-assembly TadE/G-like protein
VKKPKYESGQVMVLASMALVIIMGFAALAVDVGMLWSQRRQMQTAADAGSLAGATALRYNQSYSSAAADTLKLNGFTNGQNGVTVAVNNPPTSGTYSGDSKYVEVVVQQPEPTYFLRVLGYNTTTVSARAVSSSITSPNCIYALDPIASGAIHTDGGDVLTSSCGVIADSTSSTAITSSGAVTAPAVGVVGNYSGTVTVTTGTKKVITGIASLGDPLAYEQPPTVGVCNPTYPSGVNVSSGTVTLNAGTYCGGFTVSGSAILKLNAGSYVLKGGGINLSGNATLSGTGVTIYNTGTASTYKPISMLNDNGTVNLSAPTTGPLTGMLFFQDRSIVSAADNVLGGGAGKLEGALYFPTTSIMLNAGQSTNAAYTIVVAKTINIQTNAFSINNNYSSLSGGSPIKSTALYE